MPTSQAVYDTPGPPWDTAALLAQVPTRQILIPPGQACYVPHLCQKRKDRRNSPKQNKIYKFLKKLELPSEPTIQLLGTYPRDMKTFVR